MNLIAAACQLPPPLTLAAFEDEPEAVAPRSVLVAAGQWVLVVVAGAAAAGQSVLVVVEQWVPAAGVGMAAAAGWAAVRLSERVAQ